MDDQVQPIRFCPGQNPIESEQNWYRLSSAPELGVCSRCFVDLVKASSFAAQFERKRDLSGQSRFCNFATPRSRALFKQACETGDFAPWRSYWQARNAIRQCPGVGVDADAADGVTWFQMADPNLPPGFYACAACTDDYVQAGHLAAHFTPAPSQPQGQPRRCDLASSFSRNLVATESNWSQAASWLSYRKTLPPCSQAAEVEGTSRMWFKLRFHEFQNLSACETCYYDHVHTSIAQEHFHPTRQALPSLPGQVCFLGGSMPLRICFDEAKNRSNWDVFHRGATAYVRNPLCHRDGIQHGIWYSVQPALAEFDVCASCHACIFEALGYGHWLAPKQVPPGPRLCDLNLLAPLAPIWYKKMDAAFERNDPNLMAYSVQKVLAAPACPGNTVHQGKVWHTHDMFTCCPSCWITAPIEGTTFAHIFSDEVLVPTKLRCDFYSARVRGLWLEACVKDDIASFIKFMQHRLEVWKQTYPPIQQHLAMMRMNAQRQATLMMASVMNTGANNIAAASGSFGNWGSASTGWGYETFAGAQGAMQFQQGVAMNTSNGGAMMSIVQLEAMWKAVE